MKDGDFNNAIVSKKQIISHAWSEVLKYLATRQSHPKMFLDNGFEYGCYMNLVKQAGDAVGCNLNVEHLTKYDDVYYAFTFSNEHMMSMKRHFNSDYLFSDCVSLYVKGVNAFPYVFGEQWRKYVPIESLKEMKRILDKTLDK